MHILVIDSYYSSFLNSVYSQYPSLAQRPYDEQWRALMDQCFGTADFYSSNLIALGHEATEAVVNSEALQLRWSKEKRVKLDCWILRRRSRGLPLPHCFHSTSY